MQWRKGYRSITADNFDELFEDLARFYEQCGGRREIRFTVVGGAVLATIYGIRCSTQDVDAFYRSNAQLEKAKLLTAEKHSFGPDWLNSDFVNTTSYSEKLEENAVFYNSFGRYIEVYMVEDIYLLAMKLSTRRVTSLDRDDACRLIYQIRKKGEELTFDMIIATLNELYGEGNWAMYESWADDARRYCEMDFDELQDLFDPPPGWM